MILIRLLHHAGPSVYTGLHLIRTEPILSIQSVPPYRSYKVADAIPYAGGEGTQRQPSGGLTPVQTKERSSELLKMLMMLYRRWGPIESFSLSV